MSKPWQVNAWLLLIAIIWGFGFVPQKLGMQSVGPAGFNGLRFAVGALTLLPVMCFMPSVRMVDLTDRSGLLLSATLGFLLFSGALAQQVSLQYTSIANVSFITGLYAIIVPMIGFFLGYRYGLIVCFGGVVAVAGLFLMTQGGDTENAELAFKGDLIAMFGAVLWALHLLLISEKAASQNQIVMAFFQFVVCAVLSFGVAALFEPSLLPTDASGFYWALLSGIAVVGIGFTLQVLVMDKAEPFAASLILSLEAVFGTIAGYLYLSERITTLAMIGAALMLLGCVLAQCSKAEAREKN